MSPRRTLTCDVVRAVILLQPEPAVDRQLAVVMPHVEAAGHLLDGVVRPGGEAAVLAMVRAGTVDVVVVAVDTGGLGADVRAAGGRLEAVHHHDAPRATVRELLAVLYRDEGWSVARIAQTFSFNPRDVVDHLCRAGIQRPR